MAAEPVRRGHAGGGEGSCPCASLPKQQRDQRQKQIQQIGLNTPLLKHAKAGEQPSAAAKSWQDRSVENGVRHFAVKARRLGKKRELLGLGSSRQEGPSEE